MVGRRWPAQLERQQPEHSAFDLSPCGRTLLHLDRRAQLRLTTVDPIAVAMQCHPIFSPHHFPFAREGVVFKPNRATSDVLSCSCKAIVTLLSIRLSALDRRTEHRVWVNHWHASRTPRMTESGNDNELTRERLCKDTSVKPGRYRDFCALAGSRCVFHESVQAKRDWSSDKLGPIYLHLKVIVLARQRGQSQKIHGG